MDGLKLWPAMRISWASKPLFIALFLSALLCVGARAQDEIGDGNATIFAASSLIDLMERAGGEFAALTGHRLTFVSGSSSTLAMQINQGAPADGFISAHAEFAQLVEADESLWHPLFGNRLAVLVVQDGVPADFDVNALKDQLGDARIAMGDPEHVPSGIFAREALENLGVWDELAGQIAAASDARSAVSFVASGAAPFGISYQSDALVQRVQIAALFDEDLHQPIRYWGIDVGDAHQTVQDFFEFLQSDSGQMLAVEYGFAPLHDGEALDTN